MLKKLTPLLILVLVPVSFASAAPPPDDGPPPNLEICRRDTTWTTIDGAPLVCYHCPSATYCYPA